MLAINAYSDQPEEAYELLDYLLQPEQMLERARIVGEYPTRPALYRTRALAEALNVPLDDVSAIVTRATPRPITPVYSQLSDILQIALHRVLTRQQEPGPALRDAADAIRTLLVKAKLGPADAMTTAQSPPNAVALAKAGWVGCLPSRHSRSSRSCRCFRLPGHSGSRCTSTICACPGSAGHSSVGTTISSS